MKLFNYTPTPLLDTESVRTCVVTGMIAFISLFVFTTFAVLGFSWYDAFNPLAASTEVSLQQMPANDQLPNRNQKVEQSICELVQKCKTINVKDETGA